MDKKVALAMKIDRELLHEFDTFRAEMDYPPSRTSLIEAAMEQWLDRERSARQRVHDALVAERRAKA